MAYFAPLVYQTLFNVFGLLAIDKDRKNIHYIDSVNSTFYKQYFISFHHHAFVFSVHANGAAYKLHDGWCSSNSSSSGNRRDLGHF